jgi:hypothetical protein
MAMTRCDCDLTLRDALSDPVVLALMDADGVDPGALEADLTEIARAIRQRPQAAVPCCGPRVG